MRACLVYFLIIGVLPLQAAVMTTTPRWVPVLAPRSFEHYAAEFNRNGREEIINAIDNRSAWKWLRENTPLFESSDKEIERMYYFRWWTFRKHVKQTPVGFIITEFLPPVRHAGRYNSISCAAGHHFYEGRWIRDPKYLDDYSRFWFAAGEPRRYSFWVADSIRARTLVTGDRRLAIELFPHLSANFRSWEQSHRDPNGLFWQIDDRDGMEYSIGGSGHRPTINSYMYGDAIAVAEIAQWAGKPDESVEFRAKSAKVQALVEEYLWDPAAEFYKTVPRGDRRKPVDVRELVGYLPWYFNLPRPGREIAWKQLMDPEGFYAPYGPTTAEQRHPKFMAENPKQCVWNGPSWPFATAQTLTALANLLNNYQQSYVTKADFLKLLHVYTRSQQLKLPNGHTIPFIDEDLDPQTGEWIARRELHAMSEERHTAKGGKDRGRDYNHSTYNDLVITGFVGLRPRPDDLVEINPLVPEGEIEYFCLDRVRYHDRDLTILYDRTGKKYGRGSGLRVFADRAEIGQAPGLKRLVVPLPPKPVAVNPLEPFPAG
ncbi:MAG: hypothetical protein EHM61_13910 [Acidobacteria bacterium]|nr:MAG: hypothetical protein EHM61_13910 [Acidobacteriota bacterium]